MVYEYLSPMNIGFIGGSLNSAVGYTHFNASRLDGQFRVVCGCFSRHIEQNQRTASAYGIPQDRIYANWQSLLEKESSNLDAIVILTPTPSHAEIVIAALEAGYPVICEKSLGVSSEQCGVIRNALHHSGGFLAVTYNYSGYPMIRELRRMIDEGQLGRIQQIHIEMPQEGFQRQAANPQAWRCQDYSVPTVSLDLGVHVYHLVSFLTNGRKPLKVIGEYASYGQIPGIVDNVYCMTRYSDDLRVQAWWGKTALGYRNGLRIRVFGSKASAEWYQMEPENLRWSDDDGHHYLLDRGSTEAMLAKQPRYNRFKAGHPSGFIEAFANLYMDIANNLRAHKKGVSFVNPFVYGAASSEEGLFFLEAVNASADNGVWINLENFRS